MLSEQWGYDMVTVQDHPYHPGHLDTWTLLTWIAARTERVLVGPNVLNMAVRSPVVVAKSAASLDLLTHGRVVLGLGAGFRWDSIATLGIDRRGPSETVDAIGEAIDVVRATWPAAIPTGGRVTVAGRHHRLGGMIPGPPIAHAIPLWLGAAKPRMLRMVGTKADGWTSGLGATRSRTAWQTASAVIDGAARRAGRNPADIRRIAGVTGRFTDRNEGFLAGPPQQWIDQLLPRVIEDGVGTIVLATDDRPTLQRFASEVIPALRLAVDTERASTTPDDRSGPATTTAILSGSSTASTSSESSPTRRPARTPRGPSSTR